MKYGIKTSHTSEKIRVGKDPYLARTMTHVNMVPGFF